MKRLIITVIFIPLATLFLNSCRKDYIKVLSGTRISGTLNYVGTAGLSPAPVGTVISVSLKGDPNVIATIKTTQKGVYSFSPQAKGAYILRFSYTDTLLLYNSAIRQKLDLDSTRTDSWAYTSYENLAEVPAILVKRNDAQYSHDFLLTTESIQLKVTATDDLGNPLRDVRICLYTNKSFAEQNSPYCGGSIAYLATDVSGNVIFSGLEPKKYYINARTEVGALKLNNQWVSEMKETEILQPGIINHKTISLR